MLFLVSNSSTLSQGGQLNEHGSYWFPNGKELWRERLECSRSRWRVKRIHFLHFSDTIKPQRLIDRAELKADGYSCLWQFECATHSLQPNKWCLIGRAVEHERGSDCQKLPGCQRMPGYYSFEYLIWFCFSFSLVLFHFNSVLISCILFICFILIFCFPYSFLKIFLNLCTMTSSETNAFK